MILIRGLDDYKEYAKKQYHEAIYIKYFSMLLT